MTALKLIYEQDSFSAAADPICPQQCDEYGECSGAYQQHLDLWDCYSPYLNKDAVQYLAALGVPQRLRIASNVASSNLTAMYVCTTADGC